MTIQNLLQNCETLINEALTEEGKLVKDDLFRGHLLLLRHNVAYVHDIWNNMRRQKGLD